MRLRLLGTFALLTFTSVLANGDLKTQEIKPAGVPTSNPAPAPTATSASPIVNPKGVNPAGQPVQYAPKKAKEASSSQSSPPIDPSTIMNALGQMSGDRVVGGDGSGSQPQQTISNALEMGGNAGYAGNEPLRTINGCTSAPGKLQFKMVTSEGALPKGCDSSVKMSETLSDALDQNFTRCAKQAAGIYGSLESAKIYDIGTLSDTRHLKEKPTSLHTLGLAIDVRAIVLGGTVFDVQNPANDAFFDSFRDCWGKAVNGLRGGCLTNNSPGSVGDESGSHAHHHLHLSVPYCPQYARANGIKIAQFIQFLMGAEASAAEVAASEEVAPDSDQPIYKYQTVKIAKGGQALVTYKDTGSEPSALGIQVSVTLKCNGQATYSKVNENPFESCGYKQATYDAGKGILTVNLLSARRDAKGNQHCDQRTKREVEVKCP